ncbi:MAG: bifunctional folylpolyglutamate synthase/dihydrofolate synthase, partial [Rickettsiales bacterium]|nr:bifunctional folylpolyglutamate synthase/dihydrofolate synthase [Rickettsiales bacterium]
MYLPHWPTPSTFGQREIDYEAVFDRMLPVLDRLGNPHKKLNNVIHVAGTNGKGSSCAFLGEIFKTSGYLAHIYTSPHLHDCNERIVLGGQKITDNYLYAILEEVRLACEKENAILTFMESFTIAALLAFSQNKSDVIILECGMGGRIDATNIIENKLATLITPISYDHQEHLGYNIERIALEKAMIIRPNTPLIVSAQSQQAKNIIKILANDQKIDSYYYGDDFDILLDHETGEFDFIFRETQIQNIPKPALLGEHQYINFSAVIALVGLLKNYNISNKSIRSAIQTTYWPGRLENISDQLKKHCPNSEIFIDGAHNVAGAFALSKWMQQNNHYDKNFIITGFSKNKCKKEFLTHFKDLGEIIAVRV